VPALYDRKYDGFSSEEVYDDLMKNAQKINMDDLIDKLIDEHLDGEGEGGEGLLAVMQGGGVAGGHQATAPVSAR
jgi:hypothetical protein